jgi:hypothetical protein
MKLPRNCSSRFLAFPELIAPFCLLLSPHCNQLLFCFLNGYVRQIEKTVIEECVAKDRVGTIYGEEKTRSTIKKRRLQKKVRVTSDTFRKSLSPNPLTIDQEARRRRSNG